MSGKHGLTTAWMGFFTVPLAFFGFGLLEQSTHRLTEAQLTFLEPNLQLTGVGFLAAACFLFGPHFSTVAALFFAAVGSAGTLAGVPLAGDLQLLSTWAVFAGLIAVAGSSSTGAAPGLRYAITMASFTTYGLARMLPPIDLITGSSRVTVPVGMAFLIAVAGVGWWFVKPSPAPPPEGASGRVGTLALGLTALMLAVVGTCELVWRDMLPEEVALSVVTRGTSIALLGIPGSLLLLGLQLGNRPARLGGLAGAGALIVSLIGVGAWTLYVIPGWMWTGLLGVAEVMLIPWMWARATSDAHWRVVGAYAALLCLPLMVVGTEDNLMPILSMLLLALAAIPIGMLGWVGDEWVIDAVPGSEVARLR